MSIFRSTSFRLKKRDKAHRPPPLEEMAESEESSPGTSLDGHLGTPSHLVVPDSARSNFFTLPSGVSSRSSLFGRTSTDEKQRTFFKLPNLSRGSFILRRDREERRGNPFGDDPDASFTLMARDLENCGYVAQSKRRESASASMSNLLAGPDVIDISATSKNSSIRQRSRTLSTRSVPGAPDDPRRALAALPPLALPPRAARMSVDVLTTIKSPSTPPKLSLETPGSRISPIQLPSFMQSLSEPWSPDGSLSPTGLDEPLSPDEPTIVARRVVHSPVPTIVSATSASTIQDSLLSSYEVSSSESDPDQSFSLGEADCVPLPLDESPARDDNAVDYFEQALESPTKHIPPRLTLTPSAQTSKSPRSGPIFFTFPGPPPLPDVAQTPFKDPLENYFSPESETPAATADQPSSEPSSSKSTLEVPHTPVRGVTVNALNAGNTPPARRIRGRKPDSLQLVSPTTGTFLKADDSAFLTVPQDEPPPTPSFLVGLAWPRPPLRQIYIDTQNPEASWHSVSRTVDERLIDGTGMVNTDPCHVIMGPGLKESGPAEAGRGARRRSGLAMRNQQRLRPSNVSTLAAFAKRTSAQASA